MIAITTADGLTHCLDSAAAIATYSGSPATVAALQAAYDAGQWQPYTPPEPEPEPPGPDWQNFRLALMVNSAFRAWAATLPADWREDLKSCAILCNVEALQSTYTYLASLYPPGPAASAEWQAIADATHIPVMFSQVESE
ncbi:MAG: hypothetical protein KME14_26665 [Tildeniella torsiva UHER 1998/13D]|jgi:hypothetical protein|nr:hypothetical protein [Tildeniella torsiva UHER 1998/13D]